MPNASSEKVGDGYAVIQDLGASDRSAGTFADAAPLTTQGSCRGKLNF
jgi:hypothetical protein